MTMKYIKHGKKHEARESKATERREDSNKAYKAAEAKMNMIEKAMHGTKKSSGKNYRGR